MAHQEANIREAGQTKSTVRSQIDLFIPRDCELTESLDGALRRPGICNEFLINRAGAGDCSTSDCFLPLSSSAHTLLFTDSPSPFPSCISLTHSLSLSRTHTRKHTLFLIHVHTDLRSYAAGCGLRRSVIMFPWTP